MPTPDIKDIMASVLKTPTPVVMAHENNSLTTMDEKSNNNGNDATASPEATPIKSILSEITTEGLNSEYLPEPKVQMNCHINRDQFMTKVGYILKTKMDSNDYINAMRDINALL